MKVLENVGVGTELSKRQHLDGVVLTKECKCSSKGCALWHVRPYK